MKYPKLYNGVRLLGDGPCLENINRIDMGAMPMIQSMARTGLMVDLDHFAKLHTELDERMERISQEVRDIAGYYVNLDSGDQVAQLLFGKLGLKQARVKFTKSGSRESVEDEVLTAIQHDHPVIPKILEYKEYSKLDGTYVRPMPRLAKRVRQGEWRMFPNFNTTRVPSGRLACKEPNLLAMPTRTAMGREIRKGFITRPGWKYLSVDESQIEVRLAAHCSQDPRLMKIYCDPIEDDIYSDFAVQAFKRKPTRHIKEGEAKWVYDDVHKMDHRYPAKTCILASIYDVSPAGLLEQMPIVCGNCGWLSLDISNEKYTEHTCGKFVSLWTEAKCENLILKFYTTYPGVMQDRIKNHKIARMKGFVWDMWGRILHVAAVRSIHPWVVAAALREVGNFPYQSGAQGTIKLTMAEFWDDLNAPIIQDSCLLDVCEPRLQVHDELIFECREDMVEEVGELAKYRFQNCAPLHVPIKAGAVSADTWGDLEK